MNKKDYRQVLDYIEAYWQKIIFHNPRGGLLRIGLSRPAVSPNHTFFKNDLFYWDSYFIILGLLLSGKIELAKDIVENLADLFRRFGFVIMRNRRYCIGRTQPPFLSRMAFAIYDSDKNLDWFNRVISVAKNEYQTAWQNGSRFVKECGLNRYRPLVPSYVLAEHESGWDRTSRFGGRCSDYLPIDLNCLLYQYENDFAAAAAMNGKKDDEIFWRSRAAERKKRLNEYFWDDKNGFFYDYNFVGGKRSSFKSLAAYYALWAKAASTEQASALRANLKHFEASGGLANSEKTQSRKKQWDWPNGWPNQQWIVIKGLLNYGFRDDAFRISYKWLDLNKEIFEKTGTLWEKYDVVSRNIGVSGLYPTQEGFAWTNAMFLKILDDIAG